MNRVFLPFAALLLLLPALPGQACATDDFSGFNFATAGSSGGSIDTYSFSVSSTTTLGVWNQGPGLVEPGCTYSGMGTTVHWSDAGYFGLSSPALKAGGGGTGLALLYDPPVSSASFDLVALAGYAETANVRVYDSSLTLLTNQTGIAIPSGGSVPMSFQFADIKRIEIQSLTFPGSPLIDNHVFCGGPPAVPTLSLIGQCGQPGSGIRATFMTPTGLIGFAYSPNQGAAQVNAPNCGSLAVGLGQPLTVYGTFLADGNGEYTLTPPNGIPAAACGWYVQALDVVSCTLTNVLQM